MITQIVRAHLVEWGKHDKNKMKFAEEASTQLRATAHNFWAKIFMTLHYAASLVLFKKQENQNTEFPAVIFMKNRPVDANKKCCAFFCSVNFVSNSFSR